MISPELSELLAQAIDARQLTAHVMIPGIVESYDAAKQTATVSVAVRRPVPDSAGVTTYEDFPPLHNVPVGHYGCGKLTIHAELAKGDSVVLVFADYSFAMWRQTGAVSDPPDVRKSGPSYPVAFPWARPSGGPAPDSDDSIGRPGGLRLHFGDSEISAGNGADFVAMAAKVDARLSALEAFASSHTHPYVDTPVGAAVTAPAPGAPTGTSTASSNLKAD